MLLNKTIFFLDFFIKDEIKAQENERVLLKARTLVFSLWVAFIGLFINFLTIEGFLGEALILGVVICLVPLVGLLFTKFGERIELIAGVVISVFCLLLALFMYLGQSNIGPEMLWWALFPVAGNFLVGIRFAKYITILITLILLILFYLLYSKNLVMPHGESFEQLQIHYLADAIAVIFLSFLLSYIYSEFNGMNEKMLNAAREEAIKASKTKSLFLANMSHEIRTPMNGVIGMTDLLLSIELSEEARKNVLIIKSCGDTLLNIIDDILDISKIEAGRLVINCTEFNLHERLENLKCIFSQQVKEKNLNFNLNIEPMVPQIINADDNRLMQVLMNLLGNSFKFTEKGEVNLGVQSKLRSNNECEIHFKIKDTGIGISESIKEQLFENYIQADASMSRKYGGTGLGLVICKRLVELMGGQIAFKSQEGNGTTFEFFIIASTVQG